MVRYTYRGVGLMKRVVCDKSCVMCEEDGTGCIALVTERTRYPNKNYVEANCGNCKFYKPVTQYQQVIKTDGKGSDKRYLAIERRKA